MLRDPSPEQADLSLSPPFLRRFHGPWAAEVHLRIRPEASDLGDVARETESIYRQLRDIMALQNGGLRGGHGGGLEHVVRETVFFRNIAVDIEAFLGARARVLEADGAPSAYRPAPIFIEQPPLEAVGLEETDADGSSAERVPAVEILVAAVVPNAYGSLSSWSTRGSARCGCRACAEVGARCLLLGGQKHIFAGNIHGAPGSAFDEALGMFEVAGDLLSREGCDFRSVARTWIYLRDMDRDYAEFNRARRTYFKEHGVTLLPASTGINGCPFPSEHNFVMGFSAIQGAPPIAREAMTTPTLNEAPDYGSDFSRGLSVGDANKTSLYISGTASVDECGRTVHEEDFDAQVERMLLNVSMLLERQGATFRDMVSAITYIKRAHDAPAYRRALERQGIVGFPHVIVEAGVCRPDLLCEIEGIALLPRLPAGPNS